MTEPDIRLENLRRMASDFRFYARNALFVLPKDGGNPIPFVLNKAQEYIHSALEEQLATTGRVRGLILKGRQQGASTYIQGRMRWRLKHARGKKAYVVAHEQAATDNLFKMAKRFHDCEPPSIRPSLGASNSHELWFKRLDSRYEVATAGTKEIGRSGTAQFMHASEYAFWPNAPSHWAGIGQVVPPGPGTEIIVETTGNGVNNDFTHRWRRAQAGMGEYIPIFVPWYWQDEYRRQVAEDFEPDSAEEELMALYGLSLEQVAFRRNKIEDDFKGDESRFGQEYPSVPEEAFMAERRNLLIPLRLAMAAQKRVLPDVPGMALAGLDPARDGGDRTALVVRRGRRVLADKCINGADTMEVAGLAARTLKANPQIRMMFVDKIGIGAGVYDRLRELGFESRVMGVNFGNRADNDELYVNKRHECWGEMAEWLKDASVPDRDDWRADLSSVAIKRRDSHGRFILELKAETKKETGKSPDLADALALTFAYPVVEGTTQSRPGPAHIPVDEIAGY